MISFFISKCLQKASKRSTGAGKKEQQLHKKEAGEEETRSNQMTSEEGYCCSTPNCLGLTATDRGSSNHSKNREISTITTTSTRASRSNFAKATTSSLFPNMEFTNHESLPSLSDAFSSFTQIYPPYIDTQEADVIREVNYSHLSNHVCLDYTGFSLFSHSQSLSQSDFFAISYKPASLISQVQYGSQDAGPLESAIKNKIMSFLNTSQDDYTMVCTANSTSALKLLVETYPFHSNKKLLTVYDYKSVDVTAMAESAKKRGAKVMSANFSWPSLRIHSAKLKRMLGKKKGGLFVFPLQSRMTGVRYPYVWMRMARENGWDVVLDACALGPKDMDSFGLSLFRPDFIVCSFFKIVGENPSGFTSLLVKKSRGLVLETSLMGRSIGVVSIVPARSLSQLTDDASGTLSDMDGSNSFCNGSTSKNNAAVGIFEQGETSSEPSGSTLMGTKENEERMTQSEIVELESENMKTSVQVERRTNAQLEIECLGLDHAEYLGQMLISSRLRYITNWLIMALMKLRHPHSEDGRSLVRIYGPRIKFERGPALAFNVFDWKGERIDPALVQKLADRSNISLSCGFLHNICFSDKYEEQKDAILERRNPRTTVSANKKKEGVDLGIAVVNATLGFLTNFEDAYKLWSFVAKFLDADFVEKERWRYMALNQKMIEV